MAQKKYSFLHRFVQKIASSRLGSWYFSRTQHHIDRFFLRLSKGRFTLTSVLAGLPVISLTATGAKTGLPRTLPLLCIRDEADPTTIALIASNWGQDHHPAWYHNLKANPRATISIGGQVNDYKAHEASGDEYEKYWQMAMDTYLGFPHYKQRAGDRHIPIMVLSKV